MIDASFQAYSGDASVLTYMWQWRPYGMMQDDTISLEVCDAMRWRQGAYLFAAQPALRGRPPRPGFGPRRMDGPGHAATGRAQPAQHIRSASLTHG